jgi:hypothetical protein
VREGRKLSEMREYVGLSVRRVLPWLLASYFECQYIDQSYVPTYYQAGSGSQKEIGKPNPNAICKHYLEGKCKFGNSCRYTHAMILMPQPQSSSKGASSFGFNPSFAPTAPRPPSMPSSGTPQPQSSNTTPCPFFKQGNCKFGSKCRNRH